MPTIGFKFFIMKSALLALVLLSYSAAYAADKVVVWENNSSFTLDNGIVAAAVSKRSGDLLSLRYRGMEMLDNVSQRQAGYWSHNTERGQPTASPRASPSLARS